MTKPDPIRRILVVFLSLIGLVLAVLFTSQSIGFLANLRFADSSYYPRVLQVVKTAAPPEREHLLRLWAGTVGPMEGHISPWGLDPLLHELGFCTNLRTFAGCKQLPSGEEGEGIAKDELLSLSAPYRKPLGPAVSGVRSYGVE